MKTKTKFELLDGAIELFGLTPQEVIAHLSKKIEMPSIVPAKKFVTPSRIEAGMFHYAKENLIFPEIIPELTIDSVIGCWDKNSGLGICRDQERMPWSSDYLEVGNEMVESGFEATQMILQAAKKNGKQAEAAQYCANYAKYGIKAGQAFLFSKFEAKKLSSNVLKINASLTLLNGVLLGGNLWSSSEYNNFSSWILCVNVTDGLSIHDKNNGNNRSVRPVLALTI